MTFNPNDHLLQLKSKEGTKDYLPVQFRIQWFREECPQGTIDTEELEIDLDREMTVEVYVWNNEKRRSEKVQKTAKGYARYKAVVTDGFGGRATGHGSECAADFPDFAEKAETKAIGRALAGLRFGTAFAPEFNEGQRIVDSPVERNGNATEPRSDGKQDASAVTNLSDIPSVRMLRETATALSLEWETVLASTFERSISDGKVTLEALKNKGNELPPEYCKRIAAYLQTKQAA